MNVERLVWMVVVVVLVLLLLTRCDRPMFYCPDGKPMVFHQRINGEGGSWEATLRVEPSLYWFCVDPKDMPVIESARRDGFRDGCLYCSQKIYGGLE